MEYVRYIDRTRDYYLSQGYEKSYEWAHFDDVPFAPLSKPLAECKVGLLGTSEVAVHFDPETEENPVVEAEFSGASMQSLRTHRPRGSTAARSITTDMRRRSTTLTPSSPSTGFVKPLRTGGSVECRITFTAHTTTTRSARYCRRRVPRRLRCVARTTSMP